MERTEKPLSDKTFQFSKVILRGTFKVEENSDLKPGEIVRIYDAEDRAVPYQGVSFLCPCGCGEHVWLPTYSEGTGRPEGHRAIWECRIDDSGITLNPSIRHPYGCHAHYFIRNNRAEFCADSGQKRAA